MVIHSYGHMCRKDTVWGVNPWEHACQASAGQTCRGAACIGWERVRHDLVRHASWAAQYLTTTLIPQQATGNKPHRRGRPDSIT